MDLAKEMEAHGRREDIALMLSRAIKSEPLLSESRVLYALMLLVNERGIGTVDVDDVYSLAFPDVDDAGSFNENVVAGLKIHLRVILTKLAPPLGLILG